MKKMIYRCERKTNWTVEPLEVVGEDEGHYRVRAEGGVEFFVSKDTNLFTDLGKALETVRMSMANHVEELARLRHIESQIQFFMKKDSAPKEEDPGKP